MALLQQRASQAAVRPAARKAQRTTLVVRASAQPEQVPRRAALGLLAGGAAALFARVDSAEAAYGEGANVFGRITNTTGFIPYAGNGFSLNLPSKWNPSKERIWPGTVLRYEDNFDQVNLVEVIEQSTDKSSIEGFGPPEKFAEQVAFLFGKQSFAGETISEGGFAPNRVSAASLLDASATKDKKGKTYYNIDYLVRTADGDEGGRHKLITATVSGGKLYILNVQVGDKRWFKGVDKDALGMRRSFTVA